MESASRRENELERVGRKFSDSFNNAELGMNT